MLPKKIHLKDMREGTKRKADVNVPFVGKPTLNDQRDMNQAKLNVKNPLNGKR